MTQEEIKMHETLEAKLTKGGLYQSEWNMLTELRRRSLITKGENPNDYYLNDRYCSKKLKRTII